MKLVKYSSPGWEIDVADEEEAAKLLWPHICNLCRRDTYYEDYDGVTELIAEEAKEFDLASMLASACGCEYGFEEDE